LRAYYTDVQKFTDYCEVEGLQPFPANADTVCDFIAAQSVDLRPGSVKRCLCAIRKIHQLLRLPDPTADEDVNLAMRRLRRTKLGRPRQAKGITRAHLERCLAVQPDSPWGLRNRALLSLGYYGGATSGDGQGYELSVIAAAVVGGASLSGGRGSALGVVLGALIIQMINSGIVILGIDQNYSQIIIGSVVIAAVVLDNVNSWLARRRLQKASES
jgi:hypothetical protein